MSTFTHVLPILTNTSSMSINPHHSQTLRYSDNIFLSPGARALYTGVGGTVRQGLTHMAIPRGWTWGGPASEHCPAWCEIHTQYDKPDIHQKNNLLNKKVEDIFGDAVVSDVVDSKCEVSKSDVNKCDVSKCAVSRLIVSEDNGVKSVNGVVNKDLVSNGFVKVKETMVLANGKCITDI